MTTDRHAGSGPVARLRAWPGMKPGIDVDRAASPARQRPTQAAARPHTGRKVFALSFGRAEAIRTSACHIPPHTSST